MGKYTSEFDHCTATGKMGVDYHHIKTQASGGTDDEWNLLPLTRSMHSECHSIGLMRFAEKYPSVRTWLVGHDWEIDPVLLRWTHVKSALRVGSQGGK